MEEARPQEPQNILIEGEAAKPYQEKLNDTLDLFKKNSDELAEILKPGEVFRSEVVVFRDGEIVKGKTKALDYKGEPIANPNEIYVNMASASKPFLALATFKALDEAASLNGKEFDPNEPIFNVSDSYFKDIAKREIEYKRSDEKNFLERGLLGMLARKIQAKFAKASPTEVNEEKTLSLNQLLYGALTASENTGISLMKKMAIEKVGLERFNRILADIIPTFEMTLEAGSMKMWEQPGANTAVFSEAVKAFHDLTTGRMPFIDEKERQFQQSIVKAMTDNPLDFKFDTTTVFKGEGIIEKTGLLDVYWGKKLAKDGVPVHRVILSLATLGDETIGKYNIIYLPYPSEVSKEETKVNQYTNVIVEEPAVSSKRMNNLKGKFMPKRKKDFRKLK